jgi:hypothetical protein
MRTNRLVLDFLVWIVAVSSNRFGRSLTLPRRGFALPATGLSGIPIVLVVVVLDFGSVNVAVSSNRFGRSLTLPRRGFAPPATGLSGISNRRRRPRQPVGASGRIARMAKG